MDMHRPANILKLPCATGDGGIEGRGLVIGLNDTADEDLTPINEERTAF
jgi:hypothetical protein